MDLFLKEETYGILFFNANSFDILDYFKKDFATNYHDDDIEIIASWKLFGIHDVMILIKAKKPEYNLTNFMRYCRDFSAEEFKLPPITLDEDIQEVVNLNNDSYLFSWDNITKNDNMRLIEFLKDKFDIEWAKKENISKTEDCKTIIVSNKEKSLSLKLNDEKTKVNLKIDDGRVDEFAVKTENGELNIYNNSSFNKSIEIIEFWCDPLIPFKVNKKELQKTNYPFLISFLRINDFNINKLIKIGELFDTNNFSDNIIGLFQGYGLYDLIAIIKCKSYNEVQKSLNILRSINSNEDFTLFLDTASIITLADNIPDNFENKLRFSALLKVKPSKDKLIVWNKIKVIIEKKIIKSKVETANCKLLISHRQGFFDIIITVKGYYNEYRELLDILNRLPFVEDVATIIRYDISEVYYG